jgi:penicillin V acylase-like amidase (Ntn superfamily)
MCTNLMLTVPSRAGDSESPPLHVSARCMEMPGVIEQSLYVIPTGQQFPLTTPPPFMPATPNPWTTQFGFVGIGPSGKTWSQTPNFCDGMNVEGLSVGALWLEPGTGYPTSGDYPPVSFLDFPAWILGNFARVVDVEAALLGSDGVPPQISVIGPATGAAYYVPLHYIVTDQTGASVIVEFVDGATNVYASENGVMTNAPTYDWQITNVSNYDNVSLVGAATSTTGTGPPVGGSLLGLPGDSLSASRFVRAWYLSQGFGQLAPDGAGWLPAPGAAPGSGKEPGFSGPEQTAVVVALQLVQICMGTPYGMLLAAPPADAAPGTPPTYGDYTMWTAVRDHVNLKYYFMSAFSGILERVDLQSIDFAATPPYPDCTRVDVLPQPDKSWCVDVTSDLLSPTLA